jgi:hypothetical protein
MTINITIKDNNNNVLSLDSYNVEMDLIFPDKTKKRYEISITDSTNGKARLTITTEMTSQVGQYIGFINIVNPLSKITLNDFLKYTVKAEDGGY